MELALLYDKEAEAQGEAHELAGLPEQIRGGAVTSSWVSLPARSSVRGAHTGHGTPPA